MRLFASVRINRAQAFDDGGRRRVEKLALPVDPAYGDDVLKLVKEALNQPPEVIAVVKNALAAKE